SLQPQPKHREGNPVLSACRRAGGTALGQRGSDQAPDDRAGAGRAAARLSARARQELSLQITLGRILGATKGWGAPEAERVYVRARDLCQRVGEPPETFWVLHGLWAFYLVRGELQTARELAQQLLDLAQSARDPSLLVEAHFTLGNILLWSGELTSAR